MSQAFCSTCGSELSYPLKMKQVQSYKVGEYELPIYGTSCCGSRVFTSGDIQWDYGDDRPIDGKRICHNNLNILVKLCCTIGKSPFSIRRAFTGNLSKFKSYYYFQIKSKGHLSQLAHITNSNSAIPANSNIKTLNKGANNGTQAKENIEEISANTNLPQWW